MELSSCLQFAGLVNLITSFWVYKARHWSFSTLANAMFFPSLLSLLFVDDISSFCSDILGVNHILPSITYSILSVVIVYAIIWACVGLDLILGWGTWITGPATSGVHEHNSNAIGGFLRAAGEEIGWRCYLLPCLMSRLSPFMALLVSGIAWGLFHVAAMVVLVRRLKPPRPLLTVLVQCIVVAVAAFPHGWVAIKAGYSIWPSTVMHFVWNQINPKILGSIYTQEPGRLSGAQWLINGEGLAGGMVMLPLCFLAVLNLGSDRTV